MPGNFQLSLDHLADEVGPALDLESDHAPIPAHLSAGQQVMGMVFQPRVVDFAHARVLLQGAARPSRLNARERNGCLLKD